MPPAPPSATAETLRLGEDRRREKNWKRWGAYLSERQWGTVREDYSADGDCWRYFPHDQSRSRAYRWGEDGLLGLTDRECRLCFSMALWNERDPILKERLFGLSNHEGNHGEDVKELYYYLESTPTHSYMKGLYKYPQQAFPYGWLIEENARRGALDPEFEIEHTGIFNDGRYFDCCVEYAKAAPDDILIRLTLSNRGPDPAKLHILPTLWFRNTWAWGDIVEGKWGKPKLERSGESGMLADHPTLGRFRFDVEPVAGQGALELLFTENETNAERLFDSKNAAPYVKDAFHERVVSENFEAVNPAGCGTKGAAWQAMTIPAGGEVVMRCRLRPEDDAKGDAFESFDAIFESRRAEADAFYAETIPATATAEERSVMRQAYAGLLWSKQFYSLAVDEWLRGDPGQPAPPPDRASIRNGEWRNVFCRDIISMPDKWEYPWFAAWDLAFHMLAMAEVDGDFAKEQLVLFLREWYMHPSGALPAYEFAFDDVNPPVHAWACWRVYKIAGKRGGRDRAFLERVFLKLLINFTWWINRKDPEGRNLFSGGFLGLDNIGVFDRSQPLPGGVRLTQTDATAWMAFYCSTMLAMALELADGNPAYEDIASKFFEHFVAISDAMNGMGGTGLWDEADGFFHDQLAIDGSSMPLKLNSIVGAIPLFAVEALHSSRIDRHPGFKKRMLWFLENRPDLAGSISYMEKCTPAGLEEHRLLAIPSRNRLERALARLLDEDQFLSPYGIRSLSREYRDHPFYFELAGRNYSVHYDPADSTSLQFGGNSNWRGPVWLPLNYLLIESLQRYGHYYGETLKVECPARSGKMMTLGQAANEISRRLASAFLPDADGRRPVHGDDERYSRDPHFKNLTLFYECLHGDTGRGVGSAHQTGWTALAVRCIADVVWQREQLRKGQP